MAIDNSSTWNKRSAWRFVAFWTLLAMMLAACIGGGEPAEEEADAEPVVEDAEEGSAVADDSAPATEDDSGETEGDGAAGDEGGSTAEELTFLICCPQAAQFQVWRAAAEEYSEQTGTAVTFTDDPLDGLREKIVTESVGSPGSWDVTIYFDTWGPELQRFLTPVTDYIDVETDDYPQATLDLATLDDTLYGVPARSHVMMFYYRQDILDELGLEVPTTFEELQQTATTITEEKSDEGVYGMVLNYAKQASISTIPWIQMLRAGGADLYDEQGQPIFNSPEGVAATQVYQDLIQASPPGAVAYNEGDMRNSFATGEAAMTLAWSWSYEVFQDAEVANEEVMANTGFTSDIPGAGGTAAPLAMTWPIGISSESENPEAAADFIQWITSSEVDLQAIAVKDVPGQATVVANRLSSLQSEDANAPEANDGFSEAMAEAYEAATSQPVYIEFPQANEILETALSDIVSGADVQQTLDAAAEEIAGIRGG